MKKSITLKYSVLIRAITEKKQHTFGQTASKWDQYSDKKLNL